MMPSSTIYSSKVSSSNVSASTTPSSTISRKWRRLLQSIVLAVVLPFALVACKQAPLASQLDMQLVPDHQSIGFIVVKGSDGLSAEVDWRVSKQGEVLQVVIGDPAAPRWLYEFSHGLIHVYHDPPGRRRLRYYRFSVEEWDTAVAERHEDVAWLLELQQLTVDSKLSATGAVERVDTSWRRDDVAAYVCGQSDYQYDDKTLVPKQAKYRVNWCCDNGAATRVVRKGIARARLRVTQFNWGEADAFPRPSKPNPKSSQDFSSLSDLLASRAWQKLRRQVDELWHEQAPACTDE